MKTKKCDILGVKFPGSSASLVHIVHYRILFSGQLTCVFHRLLLEFPNFIGMDQI